MLYVGMTQDLNRRIAEHKLGKSKFTSGHLPMARSLFEETDNTKATRLREKYLKSAASKRFLATVRGDAGSRVR
jgi:putative endonuclease